MDVKNNPWAWFGVGLLFVTAMVAGAAVLFSGCEPEKYCIDGEVVCDEDEIVICEEDEQGNTDWAVLDDCKQYEDPIWDDYTEKYTCCVLDGDIGCYAVEICEAQARFCRESQAIIDYQCKGFE